MAQLVRPLNMKTILKILAALAVLSVACFCAFGFPASFELGNGVFWKVV
jgi:hypothetical protein